MARRSLQTEMVFSDWSFREFVGHEPGEAGSRWSVRGELFTPVLRGCWEGDDAVSIFYDDLDLSEQVEDSRGYVFFDPDLFSLVTEPVYLGETLGALTRVKSLWPLMEIEKIGGTSVCFFPAFPLGSQRRFQAWRQHFGSYRTTAKLWLTALGTKYTVTFSLIGVGFSCDFVAPQVLRLIVSNTNDFLFYLPPGVIGGLRSGSGTEATSFFLSSADYQLVRNYAHSVRTSVFFNVYEYQGLLYAGERKIKKITKRKQK